MDTKNRKWAVKVYEALDALYPNVSTFLDHGSPFQLLVAVIMSAQCTDARVNLVTPALFKKFPTAEAMSQGSVDEIRELIKSISFCNVKALHIQETAGQIVSKFGGEVPNTLDDLITFPGVGRKTANVILGQIFDLPGITVDTHVKRLSRRMGFTKQEDPVKVEKDLMKLWPIEIWSNFSTVLILHGRRVCHARRPDCENCIFVIDCPRNNVVSSYGGARKSNK
ncbi:MAG: endonuclease III [Candidatus Margulisbacteria bacterium]|nr:endonuclease III [Candidatus Margulisiibacteriota bacterium]